VRCRYRGIDANLTGVPWSSAFMAQYRDVLNGKRPDRIKDASPPAIAGSFNSLVERYFQSVSFLDVKASTQTNRRRILTNFCEEYGTLPVRGITRNHLTKIIEARASTPMAATNLLECLRYVLSYAVDIEIIDHNPALGVKGYRSKSDGHHTWTETEVAQFEATHPIGSRARLALALLLYTAQRKSDVVGMVRSGDMLTVRQLKTGEPLTIAVHPRLAEALARVPRTQMTFLLTGRGASFTANGFGGWFRDRCDEAGLPQCSAHGLRKLATVRLAEAGCTNEQIRAITGHSSDTSLRPYTRKAQQTRLARQAINTQLGAEREQALSTTDTARTKGAK
jgi:integrase